MPEKNKNKPKPPVKKEEVKPIYVSDPKDPRLKSYNDSLYSYKIGKRLQAVLDKNNNYLKARPGSPVDKAVNRNKPKVVDNSGTADKSYQESIDIHNIMNEYLNTANRGILPSRYQAYWPNPDNDAVDLVSGKAFLDMVGITKPRTVGRWNLPEWVKPKQPIIYKPGTTEAQAFNNSETVAITPHNDYLNQPGGVFYTPPPVTATHATTPRMNKMPMRGMPSTQVNAEPIKTDVPKYQPPAYSNYFMDSRGELSDVPQVPLKSDGTQYTIKELEKMGYRVPTKTTPVAKASINKYRKGGEVKYEFENNVYDAIGMYDDGGSVYFKNRQRNLQAGNAVGDAVGTIFPIAAAAKAVGQTSSNMLAPKDEYGVSDKGNFAVGMAGVLDPLESTMGQLQDLSQGKIKADGLFHLALPGIGTYFGATARNKKNRKERDKIIGDVSGKFGGGNFTSVPMKAEGGSVDDKTMINVEGGELEVTPSGKIVKEFINKPKHPAYGMDQNGNTMSTVGNIIIPKSGKLGAKNFKEGDAITKRSIMNSLKYRQSKREPINMFGTGGKNKGNKASIFENVDPQITDPYYGETINKMPSTFSSENNYLNLQPQYTENKTTTGMKPVNIPFEKDNNNFNTFLGKAATYGPALYNLGRSIFDKPYQAKMSDYQVNADVKFDTLKGNAGRADMRNFYNSARRSIRNIGSGSAQLQGQIALANKLFESTGKFNEDLENRNKLGIFDASKFNKGILQSNAQMRFQVDTLNEQSRANKRNFGSTAVGQLSDIMQNERNNKIMYELLKQNYGK